MQKYVLKGMVQGELYYYAGKVYELTPAFTRNVNQATLFSIEGDANNMMNILDVRFETEFEIRPVKVTIVEMVSK